MNSGPEPSWNMCPIYWKTTKHGNLPPLSSLPVNTMTRKSSRQKLFVPLIPLVIAAILLYGGLLSAAASLPANSMTAESGKIIETMNASGYTYLLIDSGRRQNLGGHPRDHRQGRRHRALCQGDDHEGLSQQDPEPHLRLRRFLAGTHRPGPGDRQERPRPASPAGAKASKASPTADDSSFSAAVQAETQPEQAMTTSGGSTGAIVPFTEIKVEKAEGENGYTVLEIFDKAKELERQDRTAAGHGHEGQPQHHG